MSLSSNNSPQESVKFPQFTVSAIPSVPAADAKKPESAAPAATEQEPEPPSTPATVKSKWLDIALDSLLVCLVAGVLGGGGYYLKTQWEQYRVPSIMEVTYNECAQLCAEREALQEKYNHADEQLLMRKSIAKLESELRQTAEKASQLRESISDQQNRVLALQHEIRRADKDSRGVARGLLPGLAVGTVTTARGKTYTNATISRLRGNSISISTPYGAATLKIDDLVKEKLPEMVLYALGLIDLVDMSDFTTTGAAPSAPAAPNPKLRATTQRRKPANESYEPTQAAPVVNTQAGQPGGAADSLPTQPRVPAGDVWQAPTGDLPL